MATKAASVQDLHPEAGTEAAGRQVGRIDPKLHSGRRQQLIDLVFAGLVHIPQGMPARPLPLFALRFLFLARCGRLGGYLGCR